MAKPKTPKTNTVSESDVKAHTKTLNRLQRQLAASNRRNTRSISKLAAQQAEAQENATEQLSLVQQAAVKAAEAPAETPEAYTLAIAADTKRASQAQSDDTESKAMADYRNTQLQDAYKRRQLVTALIRNNQIT